MPLTNVSAAIDLCHRIRWMVYSAPTAIFLVVPVARPIEYTLNVLDFILSVVSCDEFDFRPPYTNACVVFVAQNW